MKQGFGFSGFVWRGIAAVLLPAVAPLAFALAAATMTALAVPAQPLAQSLAQNLAQAGVLTSLLERIKRLERDIRTLNVQISKGGATPPLAVDSAAGTTSSDSGRPAIARLEVRLTALEEELRLATGTAENISYELQLVKQRIEKLVSDVDFRLTALEQRRPAAAGVAPPQISAAPSPPAVQTQLPGASQPGTLGVIPQSDVPAITTGAVAPPAGQDGPVAALETAPDSVLPEGTPMERFDYAFSLLRKNDYEAAKEAFTAFIEAHGDDPLAANARFWLGGTYFVRGKYVRAAEIYLKGYQLNPKGAKAPDTLLKLGMSMARLDKSKEACAAFAKLSKEFPKAPARIKRDLDREKKNNNCK